jgi:hypothetical protein
MSSGSASHAKKPSPVGAPDRPAPVSEIAPTGPDITLARNFPTPTGITDAATSPNKTQPSPLSAAIAVIDEFVQTLPYAEQRSVFRDNATRYIEAFAEYYREAKSLLQTKSQSDVIPKNCQVTVPIQPSERVKESQAYKTLAANVAGFTRSVGIRMRDFVHQCKSLNNESQKDLCSEILIKALPNLAEILLAAEPTTHPINRHDLVAALLRHHINEICTSLSIPTDAFISKYSQLHNVIKHFNITSTTAEAPNKDTTYPSNNNPNIPTNTSHETQTPPSHRPLNPYHGKNSNTPSSHSTITTGTTLTNQTNTTNPPITTPTNITTKTNTTPPTNTIMDSNPTTNTIATNNPPSMTTLNHTTTENPPQQPHPDQHIQNDKIKTTNRVLFDTSFSQITNWGDFETSDDETPSTNKRKEPPYTEQPDCPSTTQPHPKRTNISNHNHNTPKQNNTLSDDLSNAPTPQNTQHTLYPPPIYTLLPSFWHAISTCFLRSQAAYITQYNHNATALNLRRVLTKQRLEDSADETLSLLTSEETPTPKTIAAIVDTKVRESEKLLRQQIQSLKATYNDERNKRIALERTIKQHHIPQSTTPSKDTGAKPPAGADAKKSANIRWEAPLTTPHKSTPPNNTIRRFPTPAGANNEATLDYRNKPRQHFTAPGRGNFKYSRTPRYKQSPTNRR